MEKLEIRFHELPHSKPIRSFIYKKFLGWLKKNQFIGSRDEMAKVEFFRSELDQKVGCYIEVKRGHMYWRNFEYGKGIQDTFQTCLKHLNNQLISQYQLTQTKGA